MSEQAEIFRAMREGAASRRAVDREAEVPKMKWLIKQGFRVRALSPYQFRFNERLDIYPTRHKYHDIRKNVRGRYRDLKEFVTDFFKEAPAQPRVTREEFMNTLMSIGWTFEDAAKAYDEGEKA